MLFIININHSEMLQYQQDLDAPVAQWIRASASGAEGRRFESSQAHYEIQ